MTGAAARRGFQAREVGDDTWGEVCMEYEAADAAEALAEQIEPYSDGQSTFTIEVLDWLGEITTWDVSVEYEPTFSARERK